MRHVIVIVIVIAIKPERGIIPCCSPRQMARSPRSKFRYRKSLEYEMSSIQTVWPDAPSDCAYGALVRVILTLTYCDISPSLPQ